MEKIMIIDLTAFSKDDLKKYLNYSSPKEKHFIKNLIL